MVPRLLIFSITITAIPGPRVARYFFSEVSSTPRWCDTPPWYLLVGRSETCAPKRGGLKPAGKRQESATVFSGSRKGGSSTGAFCAKQTFLQGNGLPSAVLQGNGLPSAVVTRHPLGLGKSAQSRTGLGSCKSHLQVQTPQGRSLASASGD